MNLSQPGAQDGCERRGHRGRALPFRLGDLLHDQVYLDLCRKDAVKRAFRVLGDLAEEIIHVRRPPQRVNLPRDRREPGFCQRLKRTGSLWNGMRRLHGRYVEASQYRSSFVSCRRSRRGVRSPFLGRFPANGETPALRGGPVQTQVTDERDRQVRVYADERLLSPGVLAPLMSYQQQLRRRPRSVVPSHVHQQPLEEVEAPLVLHE